MGVETEDFGLMAENAMKDSCLVTNCRAPSKEDIISLFETAFTQDFEWK
jgi:alcohol dehydrogenase